MQIIRTVIWVLLAVALAVFSYNNWEPVEVRIWEGVLLVTKKPVLVIVSFLAGFLPLWLMLRGTRWQLRRRIAALETAVHNAVRPNAPPQDDTPPDHPDKPA